MNRFFNYSKGQMMILYAGAIVALLGAVALCTDVAVMYVNWQQAQKAADAAALAGATYLPSNPSTAISTAQNWPENNSMLATEVVGTPTVNANNTTLTISLQRTVPYNFGRVLGLTSAKISVTAVAGIQNVSGAGSNHLVPIGYPCPVPPCVAPGDNIALPGENPGPPGQFKFSPGNWGGLQYDDGQMYTGSHYTATIKNGYEGTAPILLGTASGVIPVTGNDVNNFAPAGLAERYYAGSLKEPHLDPNTANPIVIPPSDMNDPSIIEIPMVASFPNGKSEVLDITGFITAVLFPDGSGAYAAQVINLSLGSQLASSSAPGTGTYFPVLIR